MGRVVRIIAVAACAGALAAARAQKAANVLEIVIANGPFAGTYKPPASEIICMHAKKQRVYSAAWKGFTVHDAKSVAEAGVEVSNPDEAGAKRGTARVAFGDPDKKPTVYTVNQAPLTLTLKGKTGEIAFAGKTPDGIQLRVTAKCSDVEEM